MFCFAKQKLLITSDNNEYPVTAFPKASTQIFLPLRYRKTSDTRNVMRNRVFT